MKEQLAAMTIIELVTTAHGYATSIQQIDTHSAIVREMASRLEALNLAHIGGMNSLRSAISDRDQLAAENAALKTPAHWLAAADIGDQAAENAALTGANDDEQLLAGMVAIMESISTTATDAWQRELQQKARAEGIYFTANRLLAAWEHGFIDSPDREVADVASMILSAVEMLPDATEGDFNREFADEMLALIAKQLSNEVTPTKPILSRAIADIIAERQRQKEKKGYTESRDDNYLPGVLNLAGAAYAVHASLLPDAKRRAERLWPWPDAGKYLNASSKDPRSSLVKAAALITAEIERIDRAQLRAGEAV
ncbi:hypothetical protein [Pseudescherichia vulneris]|uniref:hypothetical protein n=1 Tax=Pseudescherichia vulneris TaxID=566 RepID=UPI001EDFECCB|nr:hypothetical protein [Pseudescherichia vulneris]